MANHKSASTAGGRTNPQTANNRSRSTAGSPSANSEANFTRSTSASPWRLNETKPAPGTRAGAPHSQSLNGLASSRIFGGGEATPGHKTSQDHMPKRTSNGQNNLQKAQGRVPLPQSNVSSKDHPKLKHAHPLTWDKSPARNSVLADGIDTKSSPSRARNAQPSLFSTNPKHNGHLTHAPPPQMSPTQPISLGKNAANSSPKAQTTTQQAPRGGQLAKSPESHNSKAVPQHSRATQDATNKDRESTASSGFTKVHVSETRHINKSNSNNRGLGPLGRHEPSTGEKDLPHVNNKGRHEHSPKSVSLSHTANTLPLGLIAAPQSPDSVGWTPSGDRYSNSMSKDMNKPRSIHNLLYGSQREASSSDTKNVMSTNTPAGPTASRALRRLPSVSHLLSWTTTAPSTPHMDSTKGLKQVRKSSKGDDKPHSGSTTSPTSAGHKGSENSRNEVVLSMKRSKNVSQDTRDPSGKLIIWSGTDSSMTQWLLGSNVLPKKQTPSCHKATSKVTPSNAKLSRRTLRASEPANSRLNPNHTTTDIKTSSRHQTVRDSSTAKSVPRRKEFQVQSSKVFSQPKKMATIRDKSSLRQYAPEFTWRKSDSPKIVSAYSTLTAAPLPPPPKNELRNKVALRTIAQNKGLFGIVSPINVGAFRKCLRDHPNREYVKSVVRGLENGFWPWANTSDSDIPTTYDGARERPQVRKKDKVQFIRQQRDEEMEHRRWSKPFGTELLPGMHSSPIAAVPKSTPGKFRLIIDQSSGPHGLNSAIAKSQVKVKLDNIHDLGTELIATRQKYPSRPITLFKSDVKSAYRQLPMHPLWQIKQVVTVDGQHHIDRCNTFGNRGGGWIWDSFISLVNWIGVEKRRIPGLLGYVDDNFGWEFEGNTKYYRPYKKHLPAKQARLLELWDELGIPHDEEKQLSGPSLTILGYDVDANAMTVKVPNEKKAKVISQIRYYAHEGRSYTLRELQSVAGSTNFLLSLYPHMRSGLRGLFDEMLGKEGSSTKLTITKSVARSLSKLADYLEHARPIPIRQKK